MGLYSQGIKCKACDSLLGPTHYDPELCTTCLEVVFSLNEDLNHEYVKNPEVIDSVATAVSSYQLAVE